MSGRASRNKGKRREYEVRDYFRALGHKADRVPSSGAAEGFKGDVAIELSSGKKLKAEVKARRNEFKTIYAAYDNSIAGIVMDNTTGIRLLLDGETVIIADNFAMLQFDGEYRLSASYTEHDSILKPIHRKLKSLKKFVKECDFLVIKIDRKPLLFLRWL